ncbi:hypothetical protein [Chroococcidiopsis cubana]|uniref:hypothetical protein n=1 Tax=Chroococcidiopsis cubana TaxID=171392 RepID=UPI000F8DD6F1|nr:hypothetical protein [Chroococcidiopsis cubana]
MSVSLLVRSPDLVKSVQLSKNSLHSSIQSRLDKVTRSRSCNYAYSEYNSHGREATHACPKAEETKFSLK